MTGRYGFGPGHHRRVTGAAPTPTPTPTPAASFAMTQLATANRIYQRTSQAGGGANAGKGTIPVALSAVTQAGTIYARRRSAVDGATILQAPWLATTLATTGAQTAQISGVDADTGKFYLDLSGDGTTWTNGTVGVRMGALFGFVGQSLQVRNFLNLDDTGTSMASLGITPNAAGWMLASAEGGAGDVPSAWVQPDDAGTFKGAGAAEFMNRMIAALGCAVGIVSKCQGNTLLGAWQPGQQLHTDMLAAFANAGNRVEGVLLGIGHNDAQYDQTPYATIYSYLTAFWASLDAVLAAGYSKLMFAVPNITNSVYSTSLDSLTKVRGCYADWAAANNASLLSYADLVLSSDGIHPTQPGAVRQGQHAYRAFRAAAGLSGDDRGARLISVSRSGVNITLTYSHQSGATAFSSTGSPATRFFVGQRGSATALPLDGTTPITVNASNIVLKLASDPGNVPLEIFPMGKHPADDGTASMIYDNHTDGDGITHGRALYADPYGVDVKATSSTLTMSSPTYSSTKFGGGLSAGTAQSPFAVSTMGGRGMTIEFWYKHLASAGSLSMLLSQENWWFGVNGNDLSGQDGASFTVGFSAGQTYHIAAVFDPNWKAVIFYVNGVSVGSTNWSSHVNSIAYPLFFRCHSNGGFGLGSVGELGPVAVFQGVRYLANFTPPSAVYTGSEARMLHYWKLAGNGADGAA